MTTSERELQKLNRLQGISLHKGLLLYKVTPERTDEEIRDLWIGSHMGFNFPAKEQPKRWSWKVVGLLLLGFGLAAWMYFEAMN